MTLRAVAEQALNALDYAADRVFSESDDDPIGEARTALRAALAEQPQPDEYNRRLRRQLEQEWADLRALRSAEQPQPEAQPVAWSVVFNGWVDADYTYSDRSAAESAASYLCKHKAELGPFRVVPLFAAPPPAAPEPSDAEVEAAWRAIPASHEDSRVSVITKGDVWVMLRAAAAARNNNPA